MARRNRATATGAGAAAGSATADDPGSSGALALQPVDDAAPLTGPHDVEELDPEITNAAGLVDFGAVQVPVPAGGTVTVEPTANGRMQAVHIALAGGRVSVSALAAPKSSRLWPDLVREIDKSLRDGGARVRSYSGEWGRELHATSGKAKSVFVGVDGPRWMLYGVATGPADQADALEAELRRMLRGTIVVRGKNPYPVRTVLPLVVPEHLAEEMAAAVAKKEAAEKAAAEKAAAEKSAQEAAAKQAAAQQALQVQQTQANQANHANQVVPPTTALPVMAPTATSSRRVVPQAAPAPQRSGAHAPAASVPVAPAPVAPAPAVPVPAAPAASDDELTPPTTPLREQAPSARRAAATAWRSRPVSTDSAPSAPDQPLWADPVRRIEQDDDGPTEELEELPPEPAEAAAAGPSAQAPAADPTATGRRRLLETPAEQGAEATGRRHLAAPVPAAPSPAPRSTAQPDPRSTGAQPVRPAAEATSLLPTTGTNGHRRPEEPAPGSTGADPVERAAEATGRRRLIDPAAAQATGWFAGDLGATGRRRAAEQRPDELSHRTGSQRVEPAAGTGRRAPADAGAQTTGAQPVAPETAARSPLAEPSASTGERHPLAPAADPVDGRVEGTGRRHPADPAGPSTGWQPVVPANPVESTGRRRRREVDAAETGAWPAASTAGEAIGPEATGTGRRRLPDGEGTGSWLPGSLGQSLPESTGRRRRAEPAAQAAPRNGTRRTLGAEYLIDTGEQAVWTGGARRYAPQPEPPTEPFASEPGPTAPAAPPPTGQAPGDGPGRRRGRHAVPEEGGNVTATIPLRALIGKLDLGVGVDVDRPTGRHRRPAD